MMYRATPLSPAARAGPDSAIHRRLQALLLPADIRIGGHRPWDMRLHDPAALEYIASHGSLGLGETYMQGAWDAPRLDQFFHRLLQAGIDRQVRSPGMVLRALYGRWANPQSRRRAWRVGERHYDLGNAFYAAMLDQRMTYTCGYWRDAGDLDAAQEAKLDLICRKLGLRPGMTLLDIGCGWGSLMGFAAERYGAVCTGLTVSREQARWARQRYSHLPLEFLLQDYRELAASGRRFDRVASVGMFEHVGRKNYRHFMRVAHDCLADGGLFLLHTIGRNFRHSGTDPWIDRYIFPGGELPTAGQIGTAVEGLFVVEDLHNFGADYDRTLMAWHRNFEAGWPRFSRQLGARFYRMWRYYLLSCAGAFRARHLQLWQWVLAKGGVGGVYRRPS